MNNFCKSLTGLAALAFAFAFSMLSIPPSSLAQVAGPKVSPAVHHDTSPSWRIIAANLPRLQRNDHPALPLPISAGQPQPDPALQTAPSIVATPSTTLNFAGVGNGDYGFAPNAAPPDTNGAVGATQYVQWVNESFAVFNKSTGALVHGPVAGNTLWSGFGGGCETNNDGDPIVQYDKAAGRWVFTQFSVSTTPYLQCVAVSTTSDATGSYSRYSFSYTNFPDYPKMGVWPDAYYTTINLFNSGGTQALGTEICAYNRANMLTGAGATQQCFTPFTSGEHTLLPASLDGATQP